MCCTLPDVSAARAPRNNMELRTLLGDDNVVDMLDRLAPEIEAGLDGEDIVRVLVGDNHVTFGITLGCNVFRYLIFILGDGLPIVFYEPIILFHRFLVREDLDAFLMALCMDDILVHLEVTAASFFHRELDPRLDEPLLVLL